MSYNKNLLYEFADLFNIAFLDFCCSPCFVLIFWDSGFFASFRILDLLHIVRYCWGNRLRNTTAQIFWNFRFFDFFGIRFAGLFRRFEQIRLEKLVPEAFADFEFRPLGGRFVADSIFCFSQVILLCPDAYVEDINLVYDSHIWSISGSTIYIVRGFLGTKVSYIKNSISGY